MANAVATVACNPHELPFCLRAARRSIVILRELAERLESFVFRPRFVERIGSKLADICFPFQEMVWLIGAEGPISTDTG
jgi:hypothetical protein